MGNGWSGTDMKQQTSMVDMGFCDDYRIFGVWTIKDKLRMSYVQYFPIYHRIENINIGIKITSLCFELSRERKTELDQVIQDLVKPKRAPRIIYNTLPTYNPVQYNSNTYVAGQGSYLLEKYKLLGITAEAAKVIIQYYDFMNTVPVVVRDELLESFTEIIYTSLTENIPAATFIDREEAELRASIRSIIKYTFDEYSNSLPIPEDGDLIDTILVTYSAIFEEICDNINNWVDDDATSLLPLKLKLTDTNQVNNMNLIDELVFDGTRKAGV
jgi:hypothetical protein